MAQATATIRHATQTNWPWRLVEEADIVEGLEVLMIEADRTIDPTNYPTAFGQSIKIDTDPIAERDGKTYVYYHCLNAPDLQCFVPLTEFTGTHNRHPGDWPSAHYWLPINPSGW